MGHLRVRAAGGVLAVALMVGGLAAACGQPEQASSAGQVVRLGALVPLTGDNGPTGQRMAYAFQMAVKEADDSGGVLGRQIADPILFTVLSAAEAEGVYGLSLPVPQFEPRAAAWSAKYKAAYGQEPGPYTMQAYDAVRLGLDAIRRAGTLDGAAVRKAIANTTQGDIELLSGPSKFNPDGTQVNPTFILLQVRDGTFTLVRQGSG